MRRFFWALMLLPVLLYIGFLSVYVKALLVFDERLDDKYSNMISNNCSDAATAELLESTNLHMDSANMDYFLVDPELAVHEYGTVMALSLGMQPTDDVVETVLRDYVKILIVAGYDGYYVYQVSGGNQTSTDLVGTWKIPYTYTAMVDGKEHHYALALNGNKCWEFYDENGTTQHLKRFVDSPLSKNLANAEINRIISSDLNTRIQDLYVGGWKNQIYIPSSVSSLGVDQPIQGPTVLALADGLMGSQSFGIGGTRLQRNNMVVGYVRNGEKYYCFASKLPSGFTPDISFDTVEEAALAGYKYDLEVMR